MEKKNYVKPTLSGEEFVPQVYCANCSDGDHHGITYLFECNGGLLGEIYQETNGQEGLQKSGDNKDTQLGGYHACSAKHKVTIPNSSSETINDYFPEGYYVGAITGTKKIRIWTDNGTNLHATTNTAIEKWEIAKS